MTDTIVIGAGQAGLSISHELTRLGVDHVVLDRGRIGESWRRRWDSFCLVTPNWATSLPGFSYIGNDPDGFMRRDAVVDHLLAYAAHFDAPVQTGVTIRAVRKRAGMFHVETDAGDHRARNLVVATGAYQKPFLPKGAETLPASIPQMNTTDYRNPGAVPDGDVLIIGSGQSGCQIAEELNDAGRKVTLACGRVAWAPRSMGGKDLFWWVAKSGFADQPAQGLSRDARLAGNLLASGHDGGRDINLPLLQSQGIELVGRFQGAKGMTAHFQDDLINSNDWSNARYLDVQRMVQTTADKHGMGRISFPAVPQLRGTARCQVDLSDVGAVVFAGGFRPDYKSWLPWADAFDADGFALQTDGKSHAVNGLWFVGLHFLRKRKSALLAGVGEDASVVAAQIAAA